jgi:hypothetical protein
LYDQDPRNGAPASLQALLSEAVAIYLASPRPFIVVSVSALVIAGATALASPAEGPLAFIFLLLQIFALSAAQIAILALAIQLRSGQPANRKVVVALAAKHVLPYASGTLMLGLASFVILVVSAPLVGIFFYPLLALFLLARFAIFGPALVKESVSIVLAFYSSFRLTRARWRRTFLVSAVASFVSYFPLILVLLAPNPFTIGVTGLLLSLTLPVGTVVTLLLYEDYVRMGPVEPRRPSELP